MSMLTIKRQKRATPVQTALRFTLDELIEIDQNAEKYANGNRSAWIRYSAINCKPPAEDLKHGFQVVAKKRRRGGKPIGRPPTKARSCGTPAP